MFNDINSVVVASDDAGRDLRRRLGMKTSDVLRVTFIPGPGDVFGTFEHWRAGRHDPRVPVVTYSMMFYELMSRLDADCQIISIQPVGQLARTPRDRFRFDQVTPLPSSDRWSWLRSQYKHAQDLVSLVGSFDPHIVVTSTHNPPSSWRKLAQKRKLVLTAHNSFWPMCQPPTGVKGRLRKAFLASQATALDGAICISHECARQVADVTRGRIKGQVACPQIVAHHPVEQRDRVRNLLFLGRIEDSKGIFLLFDVFERIAHRYPDISLVIAGSGGAEHALKSRLAASAHTDRITFLGRVDSAGVHSAISASDLLVCPTMTSFNEGLAVVGFEAATHGIPSVLSSVVPAAELLGDSCVVYEADSAPALEQALSSLIEDPQAYRNLCAATAAVRDKIYDRSLSWGSGLFRAIMSL